MANREHKFDAEVRALHNCRHASYTASGSYVSDEAVTRAASVQAKLWHNQYHATRDAPGTPAKDTAGRKQENETCKLVFLSQKTR